MIWMCGALEVSASGYYAWTTRADSSTQQWRDELLGVIHEVHADVKQRYGSPRMHAELKARDHLCSENTVAKLMKTHGIRARVPRRFVRTTDSNHTRPVAENLLDRDFAPAGPNQVWCADITYIPTREGWLYRPSSRICSVEGSWAGPWTRRWRAASWWTPWRWRCRVVAPAQTC